MRIRPLKIEDAPLMLEWMHDKNVIRDLHTEFSTKTQEDAVRFIRNSYEDKENIHMAIVSDLDEYMGTVSLKYMDSESAEFAITVRSKAMGSGYSWFGMREIIKKAFMEFGLKSVYWCVSRQNNRAIRFYDKHDFHETFDVPQRALNRYADLKNLKWYRVLKEEI